MKVSKLLREIFFNGTTHFATGRLNSAKKMAYAPSEGLPTEEQIAEHLAGNMVLGSYTLLPDNTVRWICLDVDCKDDLQLARNVAGEISEYIGALPHFIEFSGNKGYHIWIFLEEPIDAKRAKEWGIRVREAVGAPASGELHVEVFPKQDRLTETGPMGNLVKLPLGLHPASGNFSVFVDRQNSWEAGNFIPPEVALKGRVAFSDLETIFKEESIVSRMVTILKPYWVDGERHNIALALAGYLSNLGWAKEDVEALVGTLIEERGGEADNLLECVDDTYSRLAEGKPTKGFSGLTDALPVKAMQALADCAGKNIADPSVQLIDRIRAEKLAPHMKVRAVEKVIFANLSERGRFITTHPDPAFSTNYWLSHEDHTLIKCQGRVWNGLLRKQFGLNPKENYSIQVEAGLQLEIQDRGHLTEVHKRFYWDGVRLHLNFGGAEVYTLDGTPEGRKITYNGDNDFLFKTDGVNLAEEISGANLFEATPLDPWAYLTDDLSFNATQNTPADNEQQRQLLRAWILQMFFGRIMATRPIALFLGPRGSGKTTAARRILRFFEGFGEDVLGIANDKEDALRTSVEQHLVVVLDNVEQTRVKWLDNFLNRLATGAQIELRKLHTTNESYKVKADCFVALTGIEVNSNEEALFSRLLTLEMSSLGKPKPEYYMQSMLKDNFVGAWAGMLNYLDSVIRELKAHPTAEAPTSSRLADFAVFCARIRETSALDGVALLAGLAQMTAKQENVMSRNSAAVTTLELWLNDCRKQIIQGGGDLDCSVWRNLGELFTILRAFADKHRIMDFRWNSVQGFSRHWTHLLKSLETEYGLETEAYHDNKSGKESNRYRFVRYEVGE